MKFKLLLLAMTTIVLFFAACEEESISSVEKNYELTGFTEVDLGNAFKIDISQGETYQVKAIGTVRDINDLQFKVTNGRLTATYEPNRDNRKRTHLLIQLPKLTYLRLSGATETTLTGFFDETDSLRLSVDGASELDAQLSLRFLDLNVSGSSDVTLDGLVYDLQARVSGVSRFLGNNLRTETCYVELSGVSKANVNVLKSLQGNVSGNSELGYIGTPTTQVNVGVTSGGKVFKL